MWQRPAVWANRSGNWSFAVVLRSRPAYEDRAAAATDLGSGGRRSRPVRIIVADRCRVGRRSNHCCRPQGVRDRNRFWRQRARTRRKCGRSLAVASILSSIMDALRLGAWRFVNGGVAHHEAVDAAARQIVRIPVLTASNWIQPPVPIRGTRRRVNGFGVALARRLFKRRRSAARLSRRDGWFRAA